MSGKPNKYKENKARQKKTAQVKGDAKLKMKVKHPKSKKGQNTRAGAGGGNKPPTEDERQQNPAKGQQESFFSRIKGLIPVSFKSNSFGSLITAYNDSDESLYRLCHFLPHTAGGQAVLKTLFSHAAERDASLTRLREIKYSSPDEQGSFEDWCTQQLEFLQELYSQAVFHDRHAIYVNSLTDDTSQVCMQADTWNAFLEVLEDTGFVVFQPLLTLIKEINPMFLLQLPHKKRSLPASVICLWVPKAKYAALETDRSEIVANSMDAINYIAKLGMNHLLKPFNRNMIEDIPSRIVPIANTSKCMFWFNQNVIWQRNAANSADIWHSPGGDPTSGTNGEWISNRKYFYPATLDGIGDPHAMHALVRLLERYDATSNILGCLVRAVDGLWVDDAAVRLGLFGISRRSTTLTEKPQDRLAEISSIFACAYMNANIVPEAGQAIGLVQDRLGMNRYAVSQSFSNGAWAISGGSYLKEEDLLKRLLRGNDSGARTMKRTGDAKITT
jgi:hypothetical protein